MDNLLLTKNLNVSVAQKTICRNLNWRLNAGEIWGLLGPNGSGKTTLLHALAGLHANIDGEVHLQEKNLNSLPRKKIARHLGILFQDTQFIFPQTVTDYCASGRFPHKSSSTENNCIVAQALADMELEKLSLQNVQTLSGGEKRRLAIATVLAQNPKIYLLDEPMNHLDLRHQLRVMNHFKTLAETKSVGLLMATHDLMMAKRFCTHLLMLFPDGKIIQGEVRKVLTEENMAALYRCDVKEYI